MTKAKSGDERKQQNGYVMVKTEDGTWRFKHHLVAEQMLGRPLRVDERVIFTGGTRDNPTPETIEVVKKKGTRQSLVKLRQDLVKVQKDLDTIAQKLEKALADDPNE